MATVTRTRTTRTGATHLGRATVGPPVATNAHLVIDKSATPNTAVPQGTAVTFTFTVTNQGPDASTGYTITDAWPPGLGAPTNLPAGCTYNGSVTCRKNAPLANGGIDRYSFTATFDSTSSVTNTAYVNGDNDPNPGDSGSATITAAPPPPPVVDLSLVKRVSADPARQGERVTFFLDVTNQGPDTSTGYTITDVLPAGLSNPQFPDGSCSQAGTAIECRSSMALASGATRSHSFTAVFSSTTPVTNSASVGGDEPDPNPGNNTGTATVTPARADLSIIKTADRPSANPGERVTFTLTVHNGGPDDSSGYTITDTLPDGLDDPQSSDPSVSINGKVVTVAGGALVADASKGYLFSAVLTERTSDVTNWAHVEGDGRELDPNPDNNDGSATVHPIQPPKMVVSKTSTGSSSSRLGDEVYYEITITNVGEAPYGPGGIYPNAELVDDLSEVLDDATLDFASLRADRGVVSYSEPRIRWNGPLDPQGAAHIWYTVVLNKAGDQHVANVAFEPDPANPGAPAPACSPPGPGTDPASGRGLACTAFDIPRLTVTKSASPMEGVRPGDTVTYTVTATNTGKAAYDATNPASVTDDLQGLLDDADFNAGSAGADRPGLQPFTGRFLTWSGPLGVGEMVTITFSVTAKAGGDGLQDNLAFDSSDELTPQPPASCSNGADPATGRSCAEVQVPRPVLQVTKVSPDLTSARIGDTVHYTVTVRNVGNGPFTDAAPATMFDDLSDVLDDAAYNGDARVRTGEPGSVSYAAPWLGWSGPLGVNQSASIDYSVILTLAGDTVVENMAFDPVDPANPVTPQQCVNGSDPSGRSCAQVVANKPRLEVSKVANGVGTARPGDRVSYTITAKNTGSGPFTDAYPAYLTDDLSMVLDDAEYLGAVKDRGAWRFEPTPASPYLGWGGSLNPQEEAIITVNLRITLHGDTMLRNVAFDPADPVNPTPAPECDAQGKDPQGRSCDVVVDVLPRLRITKAAPDLATARPGDVVTYTVTATNTGQGSFTPDHLAYVADDLSNVLDDASWVDGSLQASRGDAGYEQPWLSWSGELGPSGTDTASATITYAVTITVAGDTHLVNLAFEPVDPDNPETPAECRDGEDPQTYRACDGVDEVLPRLELAKAAPDLATARRGDTVTYTITASNTGLGAFTEGHLAYVADDLSRVLDDATWDEGSEAATSGEVSYAEPWLSWSGQLGQSGTDTDTATITYSVTITLDGDTVVDNIAFDPTDPQEPVTPESCAVPMLSAHSPDGRACAQVTELLPRLALTKAAPDLTAARVGDRVEYTVTASNTGAGDFTEADYPAFVADDLSRVLDDATFNDDGSALAYPSGGQPDGEVGEVSYARPYLSWTGPIPTGAKVELAYTVTLTLAGDRVVDNIAFEPLDPDDPITPDVCVDGAEPDTGYPCAPLDVAFPRLLATKVATVPSPVTDTSQIVYTMTITNVGPGDMAAERPGRVVDDLRDVLDDARYNDDAAAGTGSLLYTEPELTWTGVLGSGESTEVTYSITLDQQPDSDGLVRNTVIVYDPHLTDPSVPGDGGPACLPDVEQNLTAFCRVDIGVAGVFAAANLARTGYTTSPFVLIGVGLLVLLIGAGTILLARRGKDGTRLSRRV